MLIWISDLLVYIIFLFSEEQQFLQGMSPGNAFLQFLSEKVFISSSLTKTEIELCHLNFDYVLPSEYLTPERMTYLIWHNSEFLKKENNK